jgi:lipoprotein-anchoring transpeptidase ErfK/SrfK
MSITGETSATTAHGPEPSRSRRRSWLVPLVIAVLLLTLLVAAWAYDRARGAVITNGVRTGPVALGGLSPAQARVRLQRLVAWGNRNAVTVVAGHRSLRIVPGRSGVALDVNGMVELAREVGGGANFLSRDLNALTGARSNARIGAVLTPASSAALARVALRLDRRPRNATLSPTAATLVVTGSQQGTSVAPEVLGPLLARALLYGERRVVVPVRKLAPAVTLGALSRRYPAYITIDRGAFTLRVYQHLKLVRSYPIAVGMQGLDTPAGLYHIQDKQVDPSWQVPNSAWAGSLAGQVIPPGPSDPLKARWMGIFNGAGIHGTDETSSIGHAFSHGCVRMLIPDVIDLYNRVAVGTPVYIGD